MRLEFLGAAHTVTGSCYMLETEDRKLLIDCGMFQGSKRIRAMNREDFLFNPSEIDCVLLTHAHIDHSGLIPKLCSAGFMGDIYATKATCELSYIMLPDSAHIQESDAQIMARKNQRSGEETAKPIYTVDDAYEALGHFVPVNYKERVQVLDNVSVVFNDAGHILGSAILEVYVTENEKTTKLVFSGDLGQPSQPILKDPSVVTGADYLVVESTYGDRMHQEYNKEAALEEIINDTMDRGGNLIIPAFAVGRTQQMLYYFYKLWKEGRIEDYPIVIDSPLAISATRIFINNTKEFDDATLEMFAKNGKMPEMPHLRLSETAEESKALNSMEGPMIILSASGMADAGRILHHLKHNLWRPESTVLFVGYQAEGCLGRRLVDGVKKVKVLGEEIAVKARIETLDGFSAHADYTQIGEWLSHVNEPAPNKIFIVHGESPSQNALKEYLEDKLDIGSSNIYIPFRGDAARINGDECEIIPSAIPKVSVEVEMEDILKDLDASYRNERKRILQLVIRQPEAMDAVVKTIKKGETYFKKLLSRFN